MDGDQEGRVLIAFNDGPLEPNPTWTRIDEAVFPSVDPDYPSIVREIEITAGKQDEFDETETNHATVRLNDIDYLFEPSNPNFITLAETGGSLHGKQILIQLYNPVTDTWHERFRGIIDEWGYDFHPATDGGVSILSDVTITAVGIFDYLSGFEVIAGINGDPPPVGFEDVVFYEDGEVDDRIIQLLTEAGIDSTRYVAFSGNVKVQESRYDSGDSILVALRDAADAESPAALANIYEDRHGRFVFHGRQARLDPDTVAAGAGGAWDFQRFFIGDGKAISSVANFYVQLRPPFQFRVARNRLINTALVVPRGADRTTIPSLFVEDATSIGDYGRHPFAYQDSINDGHKTNGDTASEDCQRSAQFLVDNYKDPSVRIEALTAKAIAPDDPRAAKTWALLCKSDISDAVSTSVQYPGTNASSGVFEDTLIEGWTQTITPLNEAHDMVELSLNVSRQPTSNPYDDS